MQEHVQHSLHWGFLAGFCGGMTSAPTSYAAAVGKAQGAEVAQQRCQAGPFYSSPVNGFRGLDLSNSVYIFCLLGLNLAVTANTHCDLKS